MKEQNGYEWTDLFNINVVKNGVQLEYLGGLYTDSTSISTDKNNGDAKINPGETIWMDIAIKNSGTSMAQGVTLTMDSDSQYITFIGGKTVSYGRIETGFGKTFYNARNSSNTGYSAIDNSDYNLSETYSPFKFTISSDCPIGTVIPLNLKMKEQNGYEWTHSFNLTVSKSGTDMEYSGHQYSDSTSISSTYNNKDGNINPGELIWMDIEIHNKGTSQAKAISVEVTSPSEYISFTANSAIYGDVTAGYYQSYYGSTDYYYPGTGWGSSSTDYYSVTSFSYVPFIFKISEKCPGGTTIPINMKITDIIGNEWNDSFNITIKE